MSRPEKINVLFDDLNSVIRTLDSNRNLECHRVVDQFYYMEKREELRFILQQIRALESRIAEFDVLLDVRFEEVSVRLEKDLKWLSSYSTSSKAELT